jgi:hypothetical protein
LDPADDNVHITRNTLSGRSRPIRLAGAALILDVIFAPLAQSTWVRYVGLRLEKIQGWNWTCAIHAGNGEGIGLTLYSPLEYKIYDAAGESLASPAIRLWHR